MFTGLVEEVGEIVAVEPQEDAVRLLVRGPRVAADARHGDSIAVDGVCLTVTTLDGDVFGADVMAESLKRSSLGDLVAGSPVNLERAMTPQTRFGGHIVQGHVDGTGTLLDRTPSEHWEVLRFGVPGSLTRYLVEKGSITINGTSLTVVDVIDGSESSFTVSLIPTTLAETTLGALPTGARVNLEVDVLAKYVERLLAKGAMHG
ncbi:riboflavin synthase [Aeromicrobium phragmitis]|uniref:Riboflavin synthase n=1 Tax=Aeromicrobium phragmitis TaxID=2478914 RepID=A0A3L8PJB9_9ACTN|nr:riboflavin synthase [Aeromicrobium phragmitis]RLV55437.1 riboflavin synthase [Aeromicrobium phragmitis]